MLFVKAVCLLQILNDTSFTPTLTPPHSHPVPHPPHTHTHTQLPLPLSVWQREKRERQRGRGQVMIYDRDAAFQHGMINLFWEHFTSTSLTYLGLAHASTLRCERADNLHAGRKYRGRVHVSAFVCHPCASVTLYPFPDIPLLVFASFILCLPLFTSSSPTPLT